MSERTQHFREGYAKMLFEDLYPMFNNLFIEEADMEYKNRHLEAEQTRQDIQDYLAERGYDLVFHTIDSLSSYAYDVATSSTDLLDDIPDLTEWPPPWRQSPS